MTYLRILRRRFGGRILIKPIQGCSSSVARRWNLIQTKFAHCLRPASRSFRGTRFTVGRTVLLLCATEYLALNEQAEWIGPLYARGDNAEREALACPAASAETGSFLSTAVEPAVRTADGL